MVVRTSPAGAFGRPAADVAVVHRLRVGRRRERRDAGLNRLEESRLGHPVVGHVVVDTEPLDRPGAAAERDVQPLRPDALQALQLVDVSCRPGAPRWP